MNLQNRGIKEKFKNSKKLDSCSIRINFKNMKLKHFIQQWKVNISTFKTKLLFIPFKSSKVKKLIEALTSVASKI
jgi:hypothetical protein